MKLVFSWNETLGRISAECTSNVVNGEGFSPLACLLADGGGQAAIKTVPWLREGIERINSVKDNRVASLDWSRDYWGVEIDGNWAKIYSMLDETCYEVVSRTAFEIALSAWLEFVSTEPVLGASKEICI
jgi:hypothetical protein